ncbi:MAG: CapA family protein, partial [Deltaproteobacteria bacterium]|nr:CapA family protein [Deltaproteobacteria bacterium]
FNCPESILAPLKAIGFDLLTTANNHALDRGWQGVISTIRFLKSYGFYHTGTFLSEEDYNKPLVVDIKGIKLCFIAETYHANGLEKVFKGKMKHYGVKYIRNSNQKKDVQKCRSAGADKVVFSIHWGNEYMRYPMTMVKNLEKRYIKAGADIIIGSHPHFVQPFRVQNVKTGNNSTKKVVTAWSMGNFISGMRAQYADTGMILYIDIRKNLKTGKVSIGKLSWVPTWVDRDGEVGGKREYRVIPVGRFLFDSELFSTLKPTSQVRLKQVWQESLEVPGITHGLPLVE